MRRYLLLVFLCISAVCFSQSNIQHLRKGSWQRFVYKVSAADMEQFIKWDSIPVVRFEEAPPFRIYPADSAYDDALPTGNYVMISARESYVTATMINHSALIVLPVNNKRFLQVDIRHLQGGFAENVQVFINDEAAIYHPDSKTFWLSNSKLKEGRIKVYMPGDTLYASLSRQDDLDKDIPQQRKANYKRTKIYHWLSWAPHKVATLLSHRVKRSSYTGARGYLVFNQPKYKPLDTVRYKGYVVNKKWKQYRKDIYVYLSYYDKNRQVTLLVNVLKPATAGAYTGEFILADTIPIDRKLNIEFRNKRNNVLIRNNFKIEDYVLDEIGSYRFKSGRERYDRGDSIYLYAGAKDANGLDALDVSGELCIVTNKVEGIYQDTLFVPDTLYTATQKLSGTGDTKFIFSADVLPKADLSLTAILRFKNANNEVHEESESIAYNYSANALRVKADHDSLRIFYLQNGRPQAITGQMEIGGNRIAVKFPLVVKIDPLADEYDFYADDDAATSNHYEVENDYSISISNASKGDTLAFGLYNPRKVPVYFTVFNGNKIIAEGKGSDAYVHWQKIVSNPRQAYKVRWQYRWAGEEKNGEDMIGIFYKLMNIAIDGKRLVYPGQKDSIKIHVSDYKGRNARNVNLTAFSYNNQFSKLNGLQYPPYLVRYKSRKYIEQEGYDTEADDASYKYLVADNKQWLKLLHLDTMEYYKLLFPQENYYDAHTVLEGALAQVAVHLVRKGIPQEIYLLYINRQLAFYNGVTDRAAYSYNVYPGMMQLAIRTIDKFIVIDSIYIQPHYKHDLSFDLDHLPPNATVTRRNDFWSPEEIGLLERSLLQLPVNYSGSNAYVWQGSNLVQLKGNYPHIAGPFTNDSLTYYKPGDFDITVRFEPGYSYSFSKQVSRLERKAIFPVTVPIHYLGRSYHTAFVVGDTLTGRPVIDHTKAAERPFLSLSGDDYAHRYNRDSPGTGSIQFENIRDSLLRYAVLINATDTIIVTEGNNIYNVKPGQYSLLLVTRHDHAAQVNGLRVKADGVLVVNKRLLVYQPVNILLDDLYAYAKEVRFRKANAARSSADSILPVQIKKDSLPTLSPGGAIISGKITDAKAKYAVPFAAVIFRDYNAGFTTDVNGKFSINNLRPGKYRLKIYAIGYQDELVEVDVTRMNELYLDIKLTNGNAYLLNEVVVTAYGVQRQSRQLGYSTAIVSGYASSTQNSLMGSVSGLNVQTVDNGVFADMRIMLRGIRSLTPNNQPLVVIDGIISANDALSKLNPEDILSVEVMPANTAIAIYGPEASAGAMIIITKRKILREKFRDYAFWEPNFFTDKNGNAGIAVQYPDNVTGWQTFVFGMDKKRRIGSQSMITQAYKPIVAKLNIPEFLLEGDTAYVIGKNMNYTSDKYQVTSRISVDDVEAYSDQKALLPNESTIDQVKIIAPAKDTVKLSFTLQSTTGFKDGEERKLPVFRTGMLETTGNFWVLQNDTSVHYEARPGGGSITIHAENNTLDLLLDEIKHLKNYPYQCMEQTASKLTGLAMERIILTKMNLPFKDKAIFEKLLQKVQKAQLFSGAWPWWEAGKENLYITNYITAALLKFRDDPMVEANIRNAFLFLQNRLPFLGRNELLATLVTLSEGRHETDYRYWLAKIAYDSLTQHQQWQWVKIGQQQKLIYKDRLKALVDKQTGTMLGGIHWGDDNYSWYSNDIASTVIAYKVLRNEPGYEGLPEQITRYFLSRRQSGYWTNTVESATILEAIVPAMLDKQKDFSTAAAIAVSGDSSFTIGHFPYSHTFNNNAIHRLDLKRSGGGIVYLTAYQEQFNPHPEPVTEHFRISTYFEKNDRSVINIPAGENINMICRIEALKDANYVMIEVPIPAGCIYADKSTYSSDVYKAYHKDKVMLFYETLSKGRHDISIPLQPRYGGSYSLNPAKASLMYFPTFYGSNEIKKIQIMQ